MEDPLPTEFRLDPERSWFLYVGEVKAVGLNRPLVAPLTRRYGKPASCIHVVPDVLAHYPEDLCLVVTPESAPGPDDGGKGVRENRRIPGPRFAAMVSADGRVRDLVERILDLQGELLVNVFESRQELDLGWRPGVRIIGPDPAVAHRLNNKLYQYSMAGDLGLPVPEGRVCSGLEEAVRQARGFLKDGGRAFISGPYSAAGSHSVIVSSEEEILRRFGSVEEGLLVTRYLDPTHDPTVLGIVASEEEVYIASVADQEIHGTRFVGSTFPTVLDEGKVARLREMTRAVGRRMGQEGYRGAFGCDYIVDMAGEVLFVEVNARKQGTTMETTLTMLHSLPGHPSFPEMELTAVLEGRLPPGVREMDSRKSPLCGGTFNCKAEKDRLVRGYVSPAGGEEELFQRTVSGGKGHVVLDHVGPGTRMAAGGFLARVVAAGRNLEEVKGELRSGIARVEGSL